jgi:hypothetical protein
MENSADRIYRSASGLALCATVLFAALILVDAVAAVSMVGQIQLLNAAVSGVSLTSAQVAANDSRQRLLATLEISLGILAFVSLLVWVYRINSNARAMGAKKMRYTPGWSVGWFFIPMANLVMPYLILKELWLASATSVGSRGLRTSAPFILRAWCAAWFACGVIQYSAWPIIAGDFRLADIATVGPLFASNLLDFSWGRVAANLVGVVLSVLTIVVVVRITKLQEPMQWRFGLRSLLIATTLVAAILGLVVYVCNR